jgi:hypothetical protein
MDDWSSWIVWFNLIQWLFKNGTEHVEWNQNIPTEIYLKNPERTKIWNEMKIVLFCSVFWIGMKCFDHSGWNGTELTTFLAKTYWIRILSFTLCCLHAYVILWINNINIIIAFMDDWSSWIVCNSANSSKHIQQVEHQQLGHHQSNFLR